MPNLHITLGENALEINDAATLDFPPAITELINDFVTGTATQQDIDAAADRLKAYSDTFAAVLDAHESPTHIHGYPVTNLFRRR